MGEDERPEAALGRTSAFRTPSDTHTAESIRINSCWPQEAALQNNHASEGRGQGDRAESHTLLVLIPASQPTSEAAWTSHGTFSEALFPYL